MNIKQAKEQIKDTIESYLMKNEYGEYVIPQMRQRPVLLLGAPGIGKTQIMEQVAKECGIGLVAYTITHHTRQSALGLPFVSKKEFGGREYTVTEYTMSEIVASVYEKMERTGLAEGILFIDEINCVSETLAPAMLQFLQCKTFGSHEIPQGWVIVAAGNPPEYNRSVREFDVVTLDRVRKIEVQPDFTVWKEYALRNQVHPAVLSYLTARTGNFYRMETTVDGRSFATPRGWEDLSTVLQVYETLGKPMDRDVVVQYIQHEKIAKDFANYLELYRKYQMDYQLDAVLAGTIDDILLKKAAHASFDERLSVVSLLLSRCRSCFAALMDEDQMLTLVFEQLKLFGEGVRGVHAGEPAVFLGELSEAFLGELENQRRAELLTRREEHIYQKAAKLLEQYTMEQKKHGELSGEASFALVKDQFDHAQDQYDQRLEEAGAMLEHAFDFIEAAFGREQEMVIFITELNSDYYSMKFLQQYECERYYRYNKELLFEDNRRLIEARLAQCGRATI